MTACAAPAPYQTRYLMPTDSSMENYLFRDGTRMCLPDTVGVITTPSHKSIPLGIREGRPWALDNEIFAKKYDFRAFGAYLERLEPYKATCLFVVCPDEVSDARQTLLNFRELSDWFSDESWPVAYVAQNGQEKLAYPSPDLWDYLFIGGGPEYPGGPDWKLSTAAIECIARADALGKSVHVGRVNSWRRFSHFLKFGVTSVDGSCIRFQRDHYTRQILQWTRHQAVPLALDEYAYALALNNLDYDPFDNDWYND